jgi:hypothetical protein
MLREKSRPTRLAWSDLEIKSVLGTGSFGCVRLVRTPRALRTARPARID